MAIDPKEDDWTPVRKGKLYCSPACGGKCTRAVYEEAVRRAADLADRLTRKMKSRIGWEFVVSENLGWHYKAVLPGTRAEVHAIREGRTTIYWCTIHSGEGRVYHQYQAEHKRPEEAVGRVWLQLRASVLNLMQDATELRPESQV